ncbi:MAG: polysaccharide biosynthesis protein [Gemmatales bacterium]|nr:polysaccharide biosynthesis protein [Gemmatales bacterium]MDW8385617.1 polysaccharide biosynthesis protein [Gemmatales bacterium]
MTREPVLIRVDGTRSTGWEGLVRCLSLAYALQRRRRPCHFLGQLEPAVPLAAAIRRNGDTWIEAGSPAGQADDLEELTQEIRRIRPAAVIIDSPQVGPDYLAEVVALGPMVMAVDIAASFRFPTQLVFNPTLNHNVEDYEVCPGTQVLCGRRYPLVRPEIRRVRPSRAQEPPEPLRILVGFGDDPNNLTERVVRLLLEKTKLPHLDILARPWHPLVERWRELAQASDNRVTLNTELPEVAGRVSRCHLAICDGNIWALEFACVGVPTVLLVQDRNHFTTAQRLEEEGAALCLGWHEHTTDSAILQAVQTLAGDPLERRAMARSGRNLIDGRGPDRIVTAIEVMLHPSRQIGHYDWSEAA